METEDWWTVFAWHGADELEESGVLDGVWDLIGELSDEVVEAVVWLEDSLLDPKVTVGNEGLSVEIISDSSTILYLADHVLHGFP